MAWERRAPDEAGHYWFRFSSSVEPRVVRLGYPGMSGKLLNIHAHAGDPMTPAEMLAGRPTGAFYFPALEAPTDLRS